MKIKQVIGIMVLTIGWMVGTVFGELKLIDNFDTYTFTGRFLPTGMASRPAAGEAGGTWVPSTGNVTLVNEGSRFMQVTGHSSGDPRVSLVHSLTEPILNSQTGMLFFRFRIKSEAGKAALAYMGAHDSPVAVTVPSAIIAGFGVQGPASAAALDVVRTDDQLLAAGAIAPGQWYSAWLVVDQITDTFDLYISPAAGPAGAPTLPQSADLVASGVPFTIPTTGPINGAMFLCAQASALTLSLQSDEIYWNADYWTQRGRVTNRMPVHQQTLVPLTQALSWDAPVDPNLAVLNGYDVYLGTSSAAVEAGDASVKVSANQPGTTFDPTPDLLPESTYFWRVDARYKLDDPNQTQVVQASRTLSFSTVLSLATVVLQPANAVATLGATATFSVEAVSLYPNETYQWYKSSDAVVSPLTDEPVADATLATLTLSDIQAGDFAYYYCEVTNAAGPAYSEAALLEPGKLVARWTFDRADYQGGIHLDSSGEGHDAAPTGLPAFTAGAAGDPNTAVLMGGTYGSATAGTFDPSQNVEAFSVSAWVKADGLGVDQIIVSKRENYTTEGMRWTFRIRQDNRLHLFQPNSGANSSVSATAGEWIHVVVTFDNGTVRFYMNGVSSGQVNGFFSGTNKTATMRIGHSDDVFSQPFNGAMDEVRIYNYPIAHPEVAQLYYDMKNVQTCVENPAFDFNGDCTIGLDDIVMFMTEWLDCGRYPAEACP